MSKTALTVTVGVSENVIEASWLALVELTDGTRLMAQMTDCDVEQVKIGMEVQVVPRIFEEIEDIRVYYSIERPGTTWGKAPV